MNLSKDVDSVRVYLKQIQNIKLLDREQEIQLGRQIQNLLNLQKLKESLSKEIDRAPTEAEWAKKAGMKLEELHRCLLQGRYAKDKMIQANLRLVVSIAKKYINRGVSFQDLIQEGTLGLIKATERFDLTKGYKFSTYATYLIRQACSQAVYEKSRAIRLPIHLWDKLNQIKKKIHNLYQELGRIPTESEIADVCKINVKELRFILRSNQSIDSIDRNINNQENTTVADFIPARENSIEENLIQSSSYEKLNQAISKLSEREARVIRLRYGLINGEVKTLKEISQIYHVSPETIRQIESKALKKLRKRDDIR